MKNTVLTVAALAALSSGHFGEVGKAVAGAEQAVGDVTIDAIHMVSGRASSAIQGQTVKNGVVYAKVNPYAIKAKPYNVARVNFKTNKGGFNSNKGFGF